VIDGESERSTSGSGRVGSDIKVMIFLHIGNFYPVNVKDF